MTNPDILIWSRTRALVDELLYTRQSALHDLAKLRRSNKKLKANYAIEREILTFSEISDSLTKDSARRLRYVPRSVYPELVNMNMDVKLCFTTYLDAMRPDQRKLVLDMLRYTCIDRITDSEDLYMALRKLGTIAKKSQSDTFGRDWKLFVDIHLLRDYKPALEMSNFVEDIKRWATGDVIHAIDGSEEKFLDYYRQGIRRFLHASPAREDKPLSEGGFKYITVKEFAEDISIWARSGASAGKRLLVRRSKDGKIVKAKKNKWASALAMTSDEVEEAVLKPTLQHNSAIQKRERGKVRAVIMGDNETYLKMAYVGHTFEHLLSGHPNSTLFMTAGQMTELWTLLGYQTGTNNAVFIPIDQSEFDHNVNIRMINIMIDEMSNYMILRQPPNLDDLLAVNALVKFALNGGDVTIDGKVIPVTKGVMSGWRFTALYDTLANAGEFYAILHMLEDRGFSGILAAEPVFQGDDVRVATTSYSAALALWNGYKELDFDVNPGKFFIRSDSDEFLRMVGYDGRTTGYPARAVPSLVFRSPLTEEKVKGEEKLSEQLQNWSTLMQRLENDYALDMMINDMVRGNGLSRQVILGLLATPTVVGGLGLASYNAITLQGSFTTGYQVVKARFDYDWLPLNEEGFVGTGALARRWAVSNRELSKLFFNTIVHKGKGLLKEKSEIKTVTFKVPIFKARNLGKMMSFPLGAQFRSDIPPKIIELMMADDPESVVDYLTSDSRVTWDRLYTHASKRVRLLWLTGKLPFALPVSLAYSGLAISVFGANIIKWWWNWVLELHKINYSVVERAAISAFYDCWASLEERLPYMSVIIGS